MQSNDYDVFLFEPRYQIGLKHFETINRIAGMVFESDDLLFDFGETLFNPIWDEDLVAMKLVGTGIETSLYIRQPEVERMLGAEVKYLDKDYIAYLITQRFARFGLHFDRYISDKEGIQLPIVMGVTVGLGGKYNVLGLLNIENTLVVDEKMLIAKQPSLSSNLKLNTSFPLFNTYLDEEEIQALSTDDVVLVYPKQCFEEN